MTFLRKARRDGFLLVILLIVAVTVVAGISVYRIEHAARNDNFTSAFDGIWWSVVTIATVGYGDKFPTTHLGRIVAIAEIVIGLGLMAIFTATISSYFVERRLMEGRGLKSITAKDHLVIIGFNENIRNILKTIEYEKKLPFSTVILVNDQKPDAMENLKAAHESLTIDFVKGDPTDEAILRKASIDAAKEILILADETSGNLEHADDLTLKTALTLKSINKHLHITVELLNAINKQHLIRANVDNIVVRGEFAGYMLASNALGNGIHQTVNEILSLDNKVLLRKRPIPKDFVGRSFKELLASFVAGNQGILIGVIKERTSIGIDDILSFDTSSIDEFIKRKFRESQMDIKFNYVRANISPSMSYVIEEDDTAIVLFNEGV